MQIWISHEAIHMKSYYADLRKLLRMNYFSLLFYVHWLLFLLANAMHLCLKLIRTLLTFQICYSSMGAIIARHLVQPSYSQVHIFSGSPPAVNNWNLVCSFYCMKCMYVSDAASEVIKSVYAVQPSRTKQESYSKILFI